MISFPYDLSETNASIGARRYAILALATTYAKVRPVVYRIEYTDSAINDRSYAVPDLKGISASGRVEDFILFHKKFAQGANFL